MNRVPYSFSLLCYVFNAPYTYLRWHTYSMMPVIMPVMMPVIMLQRLCLVLLILIPFFVSFVGIFNNSIKAPFYCIPRRKVMSERVKEGLRCVVCMCVCVVR